MPGRWEVSDSQGALLEPILRTKRRPDGKGRPPRDARAVMNGVLWILGTGAQWRELPPKYPPYQTCHRSFQQWVRSGALAKALRKLAQRLQAESRLNLEDRRDVCGGEKRGFGVGPAKRGKRTKITAITVGDSLPIAVSVQAASPHESRLVEEALGHSFRDELPARLIGDKAYDSDPF